MQALQSGIAAQRLGAWDEARDAYAAALKIDPQNFDALHMLGVVQYERGEFHDAVSLLARASAARPNVPSARANLAIVNQVLLRERQLCWEVLPRLAKFIAPPVSFTEWLGSGQATDAIIARDFLPSHRPVFRLLAKSLPRNLRLWNDKATNALPDARQLDMKAGVLPAGGRLLLLGEGCPCLDWIARASFDSVALVVVGAEPGTLLDAITALSGGGRRRVSLFCRDVTRSRTLRVPMGPIQA